MCGKCVGVPSLFILLLIIKQRQGKQSVKWGSSRRLCVVVYSDFSLRAAYVSMSWLPACAHWQVNLLVGLTLWTDDHRFDLLSSTSNNKPTWILWCMYTDDKHTFSTTSDILQMLLWSCTKSYGYFYGRFSCSLSAQPQSLSLLTLTTQNILRRFNTNKL